MNNILNYTIEGKTFQITQQYITGTELKKQAGIPLDVELYLAIKRPFEDELIENETRVNLARPDIEQFFTKQRKLYYFINEVEYTSYKQWISGVELREKGNVPTDMDIYLKVDEGWQDDFIEDDELVDLARPGKERFVTVAKPTCYTIRVNGDEKEWKKNVISFEEVLSLAFPAINHDQIAYTMKYSNGPRQNPNGSMDKGDIIYIKNKMIFNVTETNRS
ncbi:multiubiquitin domain-containing protein [Dysgonomonas sp. 25]|uniref:multiubiquitin domain-containing protein n=1 Tax=Dysgonomonas sp. 25 TaxID=2302933 RepID=UPI0013D65264|nr:multiubiquitin domain-containing protein [Dysgonomonas sp. 25]NDV70267.1 hypothetical protein [Dysgonomonas sp. 25]